MAPGKNRFWKIQISTDEWMGEVPFGSKDGLFSNHAFKQWWLRGLKLLSLTPTIFSTEGTGVTLEKWLEDEKVPGTLIVNR